MLFENECFNIILHGGNAKVIAKESIELAKNNDFEQAKSQLKSAKEELIMAGKEHANILQNFVNNEELGVNMLIVHAEDHMNASQMVVDMAESILDLYERLGDKHA